MKCYLHIKLDREKYKVDRNAVMQIKKKYTYAHTHLSCHIHFGCSLLVTSSPGRCLLKVFWRPIKKANESEE